jgi:hypothetical protein
MGITRKGPAGRFDEGPGPPCDGLGLGWGSACARCSLFADHEPTVALDMAQTAS